MKIKLLNYAIYFTLLNIKKILKKTKKDFFNFNHKDLLYFYYEHISNHPTISMNFYKDHCKESKTLA